VVFVSHDRYFIDRLATRVLEVENGTVTTYEENYEDYRRRKESLAQAGGSVTGGDPSPVSKGERPGALGERPFDRLRAGSGAPAVSGTTIVIEGGPEGGNGAAQKARRLNPIKQKQMEDRCAFLEEEVPRVEASLTHTEQQLGVYVSAEETQRLTKLAEDLRAQLAALTSEWEDVMMQLEGA
jgi:ATP-binding cassette subfamily F protein 3